MAVIIISSILIFANVVLWIVFGIKFKHVFSSERIIKEVRAELNLMVADLNKNALRNIDLIDNRIESLKKLIAQADRRIELSMKDSDLKQKSENVQSAINSFMRSNAEASVTSTKNSADDSVSTASTATRRRTHTAVKSTGNRNTDKYVREQSQGELFTASSIQEKNDKIPEESQVEVDFTKIQQATHETEGVPGSIEIPVLSSQIYLSEHPVVQKKSFNAQVKELHKQGYTVEKIASLLGRSIQEVQLVLEF